MLRIYNTMTRRLEEFRPRQKNNVKIFTCGPSIYQKAHLGNYRTFLYEDLLVRYLRYKGFNVERAMNLTDIEDKTISEAKKRETDVKTLTNEVLAVFKDDLDGLGLVTPEHLIPATSSIEQSVDMIKKLVKSGHAYEYDGDYFFDPLKADDFGKLFRLDMSRWPTTKRRFRKDTYNGNRWNLGDFILWHSHRNDPDHPFWDTDLGRGRPSWNIQDPAIIMMSLGNQVDINCGGIDNIYRHHDYNIALMESFTGEDYANYYMHGEHLVVNGMSMSKSRGNIIYPEQLTTNDAGWKEIRFFLTYTHYRKKLNYTEENFKNTVRHLHNLKTDISSVKKGGKVDNPAVRRLIFSVRPSFEKHLDDDLSLGAGFDSVHDIIKKIADLSRTAPLTDESAKNLSIELGKIDKVFNVI